MLVVADEEISGSVDAAKRSHSLGEDERGNHDKGVGMVAAMRNLRAVVLRNSRWLGEATSRRTRGAVQGPLFDSRTFRGAR